MDGMTDQDKKDTLNEAIILKKLDHPNIIKFKEVFLQKKPSEALNIVTEYADGGDLGQKIEEQKKQPFSESQILDYITQICLALQHIHKKKIIHRDLKSGNVFLMKSGMSLLPIFFVYCFLFVLYNAQNYYTKTQNVKFFCTIKIISYLAHKINMQFYYIIAGKIREIANTSLRNALNSARHMGEQSNKI